MKYQLINPEEEFTRAITLTLTRHECMNLLNSVRPDKEGENLILDDMTDEICQAVIDYYLYTYEDLAYEGIDIGRPEDRDIDYHWSQDYVMDNLYNREDPKQRLLFFLMNHGQDGFLEFKRDKHNNW